MQEYKPSKIEPKWQKAWEKAGLYKATDFDKKPKKYILVEFPYPSGEGLHVGHARTYITLDVFARRKRMEGANVLYPMGWDAFGLPTENYALRTGIHPRLVTERNTKKFRQQMAQLALAYDWEREINTTDPSYYKWTQWIFEQLFKNGLAYKAKMEINWCPSCKIGLANEEVVDGRCERCGAKVTKRELSQWLLKITAYADRLADELDLVDFPESVVASQRSWIGRSGGINIKFPLIGGKGSIPVFTTRPDTLFGATFFILAPEHPFVASLLNSKLNINPSTKLGVNVERSRSIENAKLKEIRDYVEASKRKSELERIAEIKEKTGVFTGLYVLNPLSHEKIPVFVADFVVMTYGTGAIMGVPGHDQRDWEFAKKHNLEIREVISGGDVAKKPYTGEGKLVNSGKYNGLDSKRAREKISADLEAKNLGETAIQYHIRDWIFSRQHYWGEPTPMVYCANCAKRGITWWETEEGKAFLNPKHETRNTKQYQNSNDLNSKRFEHLDFENSNLFRISDFGFRISKNLAGWFPVPESELPVKLPDVKRYQPTGTGESPLAAVEDWVKVACPECGGASRRETDTMPNWAGSSWYFLRFCDPKNNKSLADKKKLKYWMPVDIYFGGAEHTTLHLLYSRFWHKFLNDIEIAPGKEPYLRRRVHGVVLGEDGFKMSKSRGNVVTQEEVVKRFGADSLRIFSMFMGPYDGTFSWSTAGIKGTRRFLDRFWDYATAQLEKKNRESEKNVKILVNRLIKEVSEGIDNFKLNTAVAKFMGVLNEVRGKEISKGDIGKVLRLLAPFAPYITEELWQRLNSQNNADIKRKNAEGSRVDLCCYPRKSAFTSIHQQPWPKFDPELIREETVTIVVQVNGKLRDKLELPGGVGEEEVKQKALESAKVRKYLSGKKVKDVIFVPGRLINFVTDKKE